MAAGSARYVRYILVAFFVRTPDLDLAGRSSELVPRIAFFCASLMLGWLDPLSILLRVELGRR
jgi:hypothetical protein